MLTYVCVTVCLNMHYANMVLIYLKLYSSPPICWLYETPSDYLNCWYCPYSLFLLLLTLSFHFVAFQIARTYAIWGQSWLVAGSLTLLLLPSMTLDFVSTQYLRSAFFNIESVEVGNCHKHLCQWCSFCCSTKVWLTLHHKFKLIAIYRCMLSAIAKMLY